MFDSIKTKAILSIPLLVFLIITVFFALGHLATIFLAMPTSFGLALIVRMLGVLVLVFGFSFFGWLFRHRKPIDVIVSTYVTFSKVKRGTSLEKPSGRTESLVVQGPHRYVRHSLYFGVILLVLGGWLLLDYSFLLISTILLSLWFNFVVVPFEEKELKAIFGEQYEQYSRRVPKMIPFTKHRNNARANKK